MRRGAPGRCPPRPRGAPPARRRACGGARRRHGRTLMCWRERGGGGGAGDGRGGGGAAAFGGRGGVQARELVKDPPSAGSWGISVSHTPTRPKGAAASRQTGARPRAPREGVGGEVGGEPGKGGGGGGEGVGVGGRGAGWNARALPRSARRGGGGPAGGVVWLAGPPRKSGDSLAAVRWRGRCAGARQPVGLGGGRRAPPARCPTRLATQGALPRDRFIGRAPERGPTARVHSTPQCLSSLSVPCVLYADRGAGKWGLLERGEDRRGSRNRA